MDFCYHKNSSNLYKYNEQINSKFLKICSVFLNTLKLSYFSYGFYNNGSYFNIVTNPEFFKYCLSNNLLPTISKIAQNRVSQTPSHQMKTMIATGVPQDSLHQAGFDWDIWNNLTFLLRKEEAVYWWTFGTKRENYAIVNEYIEKKSLFESFIKYFNHVASEIISVDQNVRIIHPSYKIPVYDSSCDNISQGLQAELLKTTNFYVNKNIYLTKREIECISYLTKGKTAKEIANYLGVSPRTVETYLQNARLRLKCSNKSKLIDLFNSYYFETSSIR